MTPCTPVCGDPNDVITLSSNPKGPDKSRDKFKTEHLNVGIKNIKIRTILLLFRGITFVLLLPVSGLAVDNYSDCWEGSYEADNWPDIESGIPLDHDPGFPNGYSSVGGGLLNLNTLGSNDLVVWGTSANSLLPAMDFSTGATFEIRARVNEVDGDGGMAIEFSDSGGNNIRGEWSPGGGGWWRQGAHGGLAAPFAVPGPTPTFHTIRFAVSNLAVGGLSIYLDGNPVATYTDEVVDTETVNRIWLGDPTGPFDADWDIDYIRWTDAGAFPAPEPMTIGLLGLGSLFIRRRHRK